MKFHHIHYHVGQRFLLKYPKVQTKFNSDLVLFEVERVDTDHVHLVCCNLSGDHQRIFSTKKTLDNPHSMVEVLWVQDHPNKLPDDVFTLD